MLAYRAFKGEGARDVERRGRASELTVATMMVPQIEQTVGYMMEGTVGVLVLFYRHKAVDLSAARGAVTAATWWAICVCERCYWRRRRGRWGEV